MPLLFIARYLLGVLAVGWWALRRVKTTADFVVAGKNLPTGVLRFWGAYRSDDSGIFAHKTAPTSSEQPIAQQL